MQHSSNSHSDLCDCPQVFFTTWIGVDAPWKDFSTAKIPFLSSTHWLRKCLVADTASLPSVCHLWMCFLKLFFNKVKLQCTHTTVLDFTSPVLSCLLSFTGWDAWNNNMFKVQSLLLHLGDHCAYCLLSRRIKVAVVYRFHVFFVELKVTVVIITCICLCYCNLS